MADCVITKCDAAAVVEQVSAATVKYAIWRKVKAAGCMSPIVEKPLKSEGNSCWTIVHGAPILNGT